MSLFKYNDIRDYLKDLLSKRPRGGRGELQLIAKALGVHSTLISQIMSGLRSFTEDQAHELCQYLELNDVESEYFLLLVRIEKANSVKYKNFLKNKLTVFRTETEKISKRFTTETELSDGQKSIFYSTWKYSAIRLFCSLESKGQTLESIMTKFTLSRTKALQMLHFLCEARLCEQIGDHYLMGQQRTYVDRGSIYFQKHHLNWRLKSIEKSENLTEEEKLYTVTMGIAEKDFEKLKDEVAKLLSSFSKIIENTEHADQLVCFNCDLFKI